MFQFMPVTNTKLQILRILGDTIVAVTGKPLGRELWVLRINNSERPTRGGPSVLRIGVGLTSLILQKKRALEKREERSTVTGT